MQLESLTRYKVRLNPNYRESLKAGLVIGLWWMPHSVARTLVTPAIAVMASITAFIITLVLSLLAHTTVTIFGIAGLLTLEDEPETKVPVPPEG